VRYGPNNNDPTAAVQVRIDCGVDDKGHLLGSVTIWIPIRADEYHMDDSTIIDLYRDLINEKFYMEQYE